MTASSTVWMLEHQHQLSRAFCDGSSGGRGVAIPTAAGARTNRSVAESKTARAESKEPLLRNIVLLGLIPRQPRSRTVPELQRELAARGFEVSTRTLQRDLANKLAAEFPIFCDDTTSPYRWSFDRHAQFNLPAMDPAAALAMYLSEGHLQRVLPPSVLSALAPQFAEARRQLSHDGDSSTLRTWARRVRAVSLGPSDVPPAVCPDVWDVVAQALLQSKQMSMQYCSRTKGQLRVMLLHPQGLASRGAVTYLIGCVDGYEDLRHFALHRIQSARTIEASSKDIGFDIDNYLTTAAFAPRRGNGRVPLRALVHADLAWSLREIPLANDQQLMPRTDRDWLRLEVSVVDDEETFRWLRAQGPVIRVLAPDHWVERLAEESALLAEVYRADRRPPSAEPTHVVAG